MGFIYSACLDSVVWMCLPMLQRFKSCYAVHDEAVNRFGRDDDIGGRLRIVSVSLSGGVIVRGSVVVVGRWWLMVILW